MATKKNVNKDVNPVVLVVIAVVIAVVGLFVFYKSDRPLNQASVDKETKRVEDALKESNKNVDVPSALSRSALVVDYSKSSVPLDQVLSGGPGKDGIQAISNPSFVRLSDSDVSDDVQVMVVEYDGETKLYPYSVLVWHEIVNDKVGGKDLAITFCPLCGSAIVFEREIDGEVVDFGVSGFLYESNLLMYSREDSESLWSQSLGEAVVGARSGTELVHFPTQVMAFSQAKERFSDATIMSTNTGFSRDYITGPYGDYDDNDELLFPVSVNDKRFPTKQVFYVIPIEGNSIAVSQDKEDGTYDVPGTDIKVTLDKGLITAKWGDAVLPGYFEMWFSWATHNQDNGIIL